MILAYSLFIAHRESNAKTLDRNPGWICKMK